MGHNKKQTPQERIQGIFRAFYRLLMKRGMPATVESTSEEFCNWVQKLCADIDENERKKLMDLVLESNYGFREKTEEDVNFVRALYYRLKRSKK